MKKNLKAIILAGGYGTRLWPVSRRNNPKQFLRIIGNKTLLKLTIDRVRKLTDKIIILGSKFIYKGLEDVDNVSIIVEPKPKGTAAAIAYACKFLSENDYVVIFPCDHIIDEKFFDLVNYALKFADDYICLFGIKPTYPETGYGYIELGEKVDEKAYKVKRFIEKPKYEVAKELMKKALWNSGIFLFKIKNILEEYEKHAPEIIRNIDDFDKVPETSIDYAIMEKTDRALVFMFDGYWKDIGSWKSVYEVLEKDSNGNATMNEKTISIDTRNCLIYGYNRLIATIGVNDLIIVDTEDALLIAKKEYAEKVKDIVKELKRRNLQQYL